MRKANRLAIRAFQLISVLAVASLTRSSAAAAETVLLEVGSPMLYHVPASDALGITWTARTFPDGTWTSGTYGVGYSAGAMIQATVPDGTLSVYTRARFTIADPLSVESVWLGVDYDDGYVAWVNGVEVDRQGVNGTPAYNTPGGSHESSNGAVPNYDPINDVTADAKPALVAGENVLAIGVWNSDGGSTDLALVPRLSINRPVTPPTEIHWTLADSPKTLTATLAIPARSVLRIDPGVQVRAASGVGIVVAGQIFAEGTAGQMIRFDRSGASGNWGGIEIQGSGGPSTIRFAEFLYPSTAVDVDGTGNSDILIEDCAIDHWSSLAFHWDNGANRLRLNRCACGMNTPVAEQGHEAINGYRSSAVVEHCTFGPRTGYSDTIDLGNTKWGGPVPTVQYCEIYPGHDDGIDFDNSDGFIIGNFIHGRRPRPSDPKDSDCPQYPVAGSGSNGGGLTGNEGSRPWVMNNIIFDCYHGIGYKNGAQPTLINNTVVGCTWGIVLFQTDDISNPALAHGLLKNNLIWDCQVPIKLSWCDDAPKSTADVENCIVPGGWPGLGNIDPAQSPLAGVPDRANPKREQFAPASCSPAIDSGFGGTVAQAFHSEAVPAADSDGNPRADMASVADTGRGSPTSYDIGAVEYQGPDDCGPLPVRFVRGDANGDWQFDVGDAVKVLFVVFARATTDCEDAVDADDSGTLSAGDAVRILMCLFRAGSIPEPPYPVAGTDPTDTDPLGCTRH